MWRGQYTGPQVLQPLWHIVGNGCGHAHPVVEADLPSATEVGDGRRTSLGRQGGRQEAPEAQGHRAFIGPIRRIGGPILLVVGILYGVYSPFRNWVNDRYTSGKDKVMSIIRPEYDQVTVGPGTISNEVTPLDPEHPATMAVDGFKNTFWLTAPPSDAFRPELDVQLTEKVDLEKIIVYSGASDDFQGHHRPKTLLFIFDTGASSEVELKNTPDSQTVTIKNGGDVQHFKIAVTEHLRIAQRHRPGPDRDRILQEEMIDR